ncbi:hypothetical protein NLJ89_g3100 [Agrocybe chaxingu]|uniref:Novel STAND NTPase 1 domain-containing protein n=1 Tax=Agrocybe chaxingu TaxID=84603 RepID=A0A9W8KAB9_9AGAR|nr:hypothetical protein NLJ89_g3100 [Agrocybe chaxingu]
MSAASARCFSWCRLLTRWGAKEQSTETKSGEKRPENRLASVPEATSAKNQVTEPKSDKKLSENTPAGAPTKMQYIAASGEQALKLLQFAASVIPVPLLQDAIRVALKIIEICKEASAVEQKIKELQDRVGHLMIVIVDHVTAQNEEGSKEVVMQAAKGIERDIEDLLSTLTTINEDLSQVCKQNEWLLGLYTELNMNVVESCLQRLSIALEKFKLANDLRDSDLLQELHVRLNKMVNKVDDMHKDMKHVVNVVENIQEYVSRIEQMAMLLPSGTVIRQQMPLKPEVFHGRDDLVKDLVQFLLHEETSHVCILGPGGMGKTSVSLAVVESPLIKERFPDGNCVWVPCIEATSATLFLEILYVQLQVSGDKQVTLEKIITELDTLKEPRLILLDNFETPWNSPHGTQKQVEDILRSLAKLHHIAILVTMRDSYPPCMNTIEWQIKNIQPTDEEACLRIFHQINPSSKDDPDVGRLLTALGHMPFAVTLMANLGREGKSTAKDLLDAWLESGPDLLSDNPEESMNQSISLSVESKLVKRNPNSLLLLSILSLLPAGTTKENLRWWTPALKTSMIPGAIATLSRAALLVENKQQNSDSPVLFVVPVIQSFMRQHDRIAEEIWKQMHLSCCQYILDHASRFFDDPTFPVKSKALAAEDTNIQSILFSSPPLQLTVPFDKSMEALIAFSWHRCDTKPSLQIADHAVTMAKASQNKRYIASAVWSLGRTYFQLGDYELSYDHLQDAYQLFNTLPLDEVESQQLGGQCGIDLVDAVRMKGDTGQAVSLARCVETKCAALSDGLVHGRSLVYLGQALYEHEEREEALVYLERAILMLKPVGNAPNLAEAYQVISRVHYDEGRLPEALDALEEARAHAELSGSPNIQADIYLEFGKALFSANRDTEAWRYIEVALMKASHVGTRLTIARALQYMGYGYLRRGDYKNAYGAYETAAKKYLGTTNTRVEDRCKENMTRIQQKEENPDAVVGFYRPHMDVDKSFFYPHFQVSASDAPIPGS